MSRRRLDWAGCGVCLQPPPGDQCLHEPGFCPLRWGLGLALGALRVSEHGLGPGPPLTRKERSSCLPRKPAGQRPLAALTPVPRPVSAPCGVPGVAGQDECPRTSDTSHCPASIVNTCFCVAPQLLQAREAADRKQRPPVSGARLTHCPARSGSSTRTGRLCGAPPPKLLP